MLTTSLHQGYMSSNGFWAHRFPIEHLAIQDDFMATGACSELKVWNRNAGMLSLDTTMNAFHTHTLQMMRVAA